MGAVTQSSSKCAKLCNDKMLHICIYVYILKEFDHEILSVASLCFNRCHSLLPIKIVIFLPYCLIKEFKQNNSG